MMGRYYAGDPQKFQRVTTSVRLRIEQMERVRKERMNLSNFIEDCLDYYWNVRNPIDDARELQKRADAAARAQAVPISKELSKFEEQVSKMERAVGPLGEHPTPTEEEMEARHKEFEKKFPDAYKSEKDQLGEKKRKNAKQDKAGRANNA
ncbi:MAG: hypothetical protein HWN68_13860 [Desulfobacterales bacterium]|nr:hypothetical protein [Desulfobacterales bacterium]